MTTAMAPPGNHEQPFEPIAASGSLLRAEIHRFSARRFIRVLLAIALVAYLGIVLLMAFQEFGNPSAAELQMAELRQEQAITETNAAREQCLQQEDPEQFPPGTTLEDVCGPEQTPETLPLDEFLDKQRFVLAEHLQSGAVVVGSFTSMLAFLIGATYVGAEWSTRSMVALLFWEPRRLRVVGAKLLVAGGMAALLGLVAQLLWAATAVLLAHTRGTTAGLPRNFWADVLAQQGRCVALVTLIALLGFSLANLIRNTGASLGVGFVYFAIVENVVRGFRPGWQQWLLTENIAALLTDGGLRLFVGGSEDQPRQVLLSNLHGALVIGGVTAVFVAIGVTLFKRRDLH